MFTKKSAIFLAANLLLCSFICAADEQDEELRSGKCKKFSSLTVCNSVTASSFITPTGPLFNGLRNYAVLANNETVNSNDFVLWGATDSANISAGISLANDGTITLPTSGIFLVQYSVNFTMDSDSTMDPSTANATLVNAATLSDIQPTIVTAIGLANNSPGGTSEITGYALITTTPTSNNNTIRLKINLSNGATLPFNDPAANAQMVILQLN